MPINAFKNDVTPYAENIMNTLLSLQDFSLIYEGAEVDSATGAGVTENLVADYSFAIRVTATGVTELSRIELEVSADGAGQDLTIEVRDDDFNPDGSAEGTLLKSVVVPKEFLPADAAYWSIPLDLTGLTLGQNVWVVVNKVGDITDHFHLVGEAAQDAAHPVYRRAGTSGAWTANNALHFKVFSGESGELVHGIYGENGYTTVEYDGEMVSKVYCYLPPADGPVGGIRDAQEYTWSGEYLKSGVVT